jgi:hypothetical protein
MKKIFGISMVHEGAPFGNKNASGPHNLSARKKSVPNRIVGAGLVRNVDGNILAQFKRTTYRQPPKMVTYQNVTGKSADRFERVAKKHQKNKGTYAGRVWKGMGLSTITRRIA